MTKAVKKLAAVISKSYKEGLSDGCAGITREFGNFKAPFKNAEYERGWYAGQAACTCRPPN